MKDPRYIIITSAFNEAKNISKTIQSVVKQSVLPVQWVIVDDNSIDETESIVKKYSADYKFISIHKKEKEAIEFGGHMAGNILFGLTKIQNSEWDYIALLDADIEIDRADYYEYQLNRFEEDLDLGISSGITYYFQDSKKKMNNKRPYWRTGGATKLYRRSCFQEIGGIAPIFAWDGLDVYKAMFRGWKTRTFYKLEVNHLGGERMEERHRSISKADLIGKSLYQRGFPIEFVFLKRIQIYLLGKPKYANNLFNSYLNSKRNCIPQFVNNDEKAFIRKVQYLRVFDKLIPIKLL